MAETEYQYYPYRSVISKGSRDIVLSPRQNVLVWTLHYNDELTAKDFCRKLRITPTEIFTLANFSTKLYQLKRRIDDNNFIVTNDGSNGEIRFSFGRRVVVRDEQHDFYGFLDYTNRFVHRSAVGEEEKISFFDFISSHLCNDNRIVDLSPIESQILYLLIHFQDTPLTNSNLSEYIKLFFYMEHSLETLRSAVYITKRKLERVGVSFTGYHYQLNKNRPVMLANKRVDL